VKFDYTRFCRIKQLPGVGIPPRVVSHLDDDVTGHLKSQAPSIKCQTNNKSKTIKQPNNGKNRIRFYALGVFLIVVCSLFVIWCLRFGILGGA
jgi:hypothetical protein